jgi:hypothetical protein
MKFINHRSVICNHQLPCPISGPYSSMSIQLPDLREGAILQGTMFGEPMRVVGAPRHEYGFI